MFWTFVCPASIKSSFSCEVCLCHVILHETCQKTGSSITHLLSDWQYCYLINVTPFVLTSCARLSLDTSPQIESPSPCIPPLHQPQLPPPPTAPTPPPQHLQHQQGAAALIPRKKTRIHRSSSDPVLMDLTAKGLPFWPVCNDSKFENCYTSVRWENHVRLMLNGNVVASSESLAQVMNWPRPQTCWMLKHSSVIVAGTLTLWDLMLNTVDSLVLALKQHNSCIRIRIEWFRDTC